MDKVSSIGFRFPTSTNAIFCRMVQFEEDKLKNVFVQLSGFGLANIPILILSYCKVKLKRGASQVALVVKNPPVNVGDVKDQSLIPGSGRTLGGMAADARILAWRIHAQRSLAGYSP